MTRLYRRFRSGEFDLAPLGVERREENYPYFCTPCGASVFGWAGVDGIHFCTVRGFGETVFAVSPQNGAENCVHPVAEDFRAFLRLLLACKDAAALEQAWQWDETQFLGFLRSLPPDGERDAALRALRDASGLTPMEESFAYIRALQSSFDYGRLRFTEDFYDPDMNGGAEKPAAPRPAPAWKVWFDGGFFAGHTGRSRAGKELPLHAHFDWAGRAWVVPAAYLCAKGIVVDFCMRTEAAQLRAFREKWGLTGEETCEDVSPEREEEIGRDNPLTLDFRPALTLNGRALSMSHGCSVCFCPEESGVEAACADMDAVWTAEHYGLELSCGWTISRYAFPWPGRRPKEIRSLSLSMTQEPVRISGPRFAVRSPGCTVSLALPEGTECTLTVLSCEPETIPLPPSAQERWIFPPRCLTLRYTLTPAQPAGSVFLRDACPGDSPVPCLRDSGEDAPGASASEYAFLPEASPAAAIGVIGGADGPNAVFVSAGTGGPERHDVLAACSSLYYELPERIEWQAVFCRTQFGTGEFRLL